MVAKYIKIYQNNDKENLVEYRNKITKLEETLITIIKNYSFRKFVFLELG